jgi:hypothetical protein
MAYRLLAWLLLFVLGITVGTVTCRQLPASTAPLDLADMAQNAQSKSAAEGKSIHSQDLLLLYNVL